MRDTGPRPEVRALVRERFDGTCARCGRPGDHLHHRKARGSGGTRDPAINTAPNLVWLCLFCHGWCHAEPKQAHEDGWVCWSWENPAERPCLTVLDTMVMFLPDGSAVVDRLWPRTNPGPPI